MPSDSEILETARMIRLAGREIARKRDANASSLGITSTQADALILVRDNPGCSITFLRDNLGTTHQASRALVDRMRLNGLVLVGTHDDDARVRTVDLTDRGVRILDEFLRMGVEVNTTLFGTLDEEGFRHLRESLSRIPLRRR